MIKPKTPEEVIAFIGSNYNSMIPTADPVMNESGEWVTGELLPLEDIVYSLTVHDLLSAFSEWSDERLRCEPCRETGLVHCSDPENCGGPWTVANQSL